LIFDKFKRYMPKRKITINLIIIFLLAFFSFCLIFPEYLNRRIDFFNSLKIMETIEITIPHFPEIPFKLGLDLQGGSRLVYEADLAEIEEKEKGEAMQGLRDVIERRINIFGVREPIVRVEEKAEHQRLVVELPGIKNVAEAIEMIGKTPYLEFREERTDTETEEILKQLEEKKKGEQEGEEQQGEQEREGEGKEEQPEEKQLEEEQPEKQSDEEQPEEEQGQEIISGDEDPYFKPTKLTGKYLKKATLGFNQTTLEPQVLLEFDSEGSEIFKNLTSKNVGKRLAIYIDNVLISAPVVREEISGGKAQITGRFSVDEAKELARNLNAGALPVPIELISQTTIGPTLGKVSLDKSLKAGIFGFLAVVLFMICFYRLSGFLASLALLIYGGILLSLFKLIPVTLTLAGIGGAILSVGMAVDANVLIFERQKEERKSGESFSRTIEMAFSRAWPSIRDSNVTTLIVALIMFSFGTSFVKGFALTLSLGILTSLFSALFITKTFLKMFIGTKLEKIDWLWS